VQQAQGFFCYRLSGDIQEVCDMPKEKTLKKKGLVIDSIKENFDSCSIGILTDYRGLTTSEINDLRRRLRESGIQYRVVKNTMARFAAERSGKDELVGLFEGPVAIAFGYEEVTGPAKALIDYIRDTKSILSIKGGFYGDRLLTPQEVTTLSTLPSRDVLIAKVVGGMQSPIYALVGCLANPMRGLMGVLRARIEQLEGE